ncbi:polymorphic toxin type 30 domain-containing protein [Paenilisteria weihenstephanensis]|nr:polymorphic toxin type 30 domain-containing protein [Listeria weihenstephanensis]
MAESVVKGLASVKNSSGFSATSGTFSASGLDMSWQTGIQKAEDMKKGIDPKKIKELEAYNVYAVVYEGKDGKAEILWHLEKDGKGVTSPELDTYLNKAGKYLDEEKYTIWSMADYTKRLQDGWRDGINYQNGDEYSSFIKGTLSASQHVEDGYNWVSQTGMYDLVLMAGLSYASYKVTTLKKVVGGQGTGKVGNFNNIQGTTIDDILTRIPKDAHKRLLTPQTGKVTEGFEYTWKTQEGTKMTVRVHGPDPSALAGSNAANGWIVRVQQGKKYLDPVSGEFQPPGISRPSSEFYNEEIINSTHISIQTPKK